jgi:hypothetical protein
MQPTTNASDDGPAFPPAAYIASKLSQLFLFAGGIGAGASLLHVVVHFQFTGDNDFIQVCRRMHSVLTVRVYQFDSISVSTSGCRLV